MKTPSTQTFRNRLINVMRLAAVLTLSLALLIFVGLGEARRTYPRFAIEKLAAQGELVQTAMKGFLLADLPLSQFPGFTTTTQPILQSDTSIYAIYVTNLQDQVVFANGQSLTELGDLSAQAAIQPDVNRFLVTENAQFYRVSFNLTTALPWSANCTFCCPSRWWRPTSTRPSSRCRARQWRQCVCICSSCSTPASAG
jgi:hypothetical protein